MLSLSVRQPFAERLANGSKKAEFRSWPIAHRGPILIVASKTAANDAGASLPRGVAICVVDVVDCRPDDAGGFAWHVVNPRRVEPTPIMGRAALFHTDDAVLRYVTVDRPQTASHATTYRLRLQDGRIVGAADDAVSARALATAYARERGVDVTIEAFGFDGVTIYVPGSEPRPGARARGDVFTFARAADGTPVHGSERTLQRAETTRAFLERLHNTQIVVVKGRPR